MTGLLVSVRDAREAAVALAAGADLIDVKEPRRGSLGAADSLVIAAVIADVGGRVPVSAALGELLDAEVDPATLPHGLQYAKLGLAGCASVANWAQQWRLAMDAMPSSVQKVAVVYADWRHALAPSPKEVLQQAIECRCAAVLVDTFDKSQGGLLDHWPVEELAPFAGAVRDQRLRLVLAGSLTSAVFPKLLPLEPDYLAVRGAACREHRTGTIDGRRVKALVGLLR